jgi:hypothetical protein
MKTETYLGPYSDCSHCIKDDPIPIAHTGDLLDYNIHDNIYQLRYDHTDTLRF